MKEKVENLKLEVANKLEATTNLKEVNDLKVEYLGKKGKKIDENPNTKIDSDMYDLLSKVFQGEKKLKEASKITKKTTKPVEIVLDATEVVKKEKEERKEEEVPTNEIVIRDVTLGKENKKEKVADKK